MAAQALLAQKEITATILLLPQIASVGLSLLVVAAGLHHLPGQHLQAAEVAEVAAAVQVITVVRH
jgi:hypothetical protein